VKKGVDKKEKVWYSKQAPSESESEKVERTLAGAFVPERSS
jgi:ribosomal protein S3AE